MKNKVFVGIDTSNYTTSCAICDLNGFVLENYKALLPVKNGENGLRQSDAVFAHVKNFEIIANYIKQKHAEYEIVAVGYSAYPRDCKDSYMPCFLVGKAVAEMICSLYNIDIFKFSHQMGHVQAAIYSAGLDTSDDFLAFHVSGGTTEVLHVLPCENTYKIGQIGGTIDLNAGQAIDRIGVKMGLQFPCGRAMESLALQNTEKIPSFNVCVNEYECNLSGLENLAENLFVKTSNPSLVSAFVFEFISKTLIKIATNLRNKYPNKAIVFAGGVMSNSIIQKKLSNSFENVYFAKPEFSADNAAGIAILTLKEYKGRKV